MKGQSQSELDSEQVNCSPEQLKIIKSKTLKNFTTTRCILIPECNNAGYMKYTGCYFHQYKQATFIKIMLE
jgi:hypothetical protein